MISGRVNYTPEVEGKINHMIWMCQCIERTYKGLEGMIRGNEELHTLVGFCEYLNFCGVRMHILAGKWMKYQVVRGGQVRFEQTKTFIPVPMEIVQNTARAMIKALETILECEKQLEQQVRELFFLANEKRDICTLELVEAKFMPAQLRMIRFTVGFLNTLVHSGNQQYMHDRLTFKPIVLGLGRLIETGEIKKLSLVFNDKMVMLHLETAWFQMKTGDWTLNQPIQGENKKWGVVVGPVDAKHGSDWTLTTDFFSL